MRPERTMTAQECELVEANLKLVPYVVNKNLWCREIYGTIDDAISAGYIALCHAAQGYTPSRGRFSTYACMAIFRELARGRQLSNNKCRKAPGPVLSLDRKIPGTDRYLGEVIPARGDLEREMIAQATAERLEAMAHRRGLSRAFRIVRRVADGETLKSIGDSMGLTRERARQIYADARRDIRRLERI